MFAGLQASSFIVFAIIIGEVCAKFSMTVLTAYGTPFREGIHSYLHQFSQPYFPLIAAFLCAPILFIPIAPLKLMSAIIVAVLCPTIMLYVWKGGYASNTHVTDFHPPLLTPFDDMMNVDVQ